MKKLIILAIILLTTTSSFSQSKLYAYLLESGSWNSYTGHWEYKKPIDVNLTFTVTKAFISINDVANTVFAVDSYEGEENGVTTDGVKYVAVRWGCTDEKYRRCKFSMIKYEDGIYLITVMYNDYSFRYYVRATRLSNF
jgi:hypothetical protein